MSNWTDRLRRLSLSNSGSATSSGGYANSGVHVGDINLLTGTPVRTRYHQQVLRIAPPQLLDRDAELAELADFCTSPSAAGSYAWWRASAWTGKSALMSWFVLHPPPGVRLVSFFVTARLASQNDRAAFIDNVMEQLLALLGEGLPPFLTEATREAHLLGLISDAAEASRSRNESFVLLVDGLDEDRGAHLGHSIAGLLPAELPAGMRIVVVSRPHPPISGDVPAYHPLRDPAIVRSLATSPQAQTMRLEMERDLRRLLEGSVAEHDLLGLVASAGGGLSADDLADLTGLSRWQLSNHLCTVAGRSFSARGSHYAPDVSPDVYLLGHEELQLIALDMLGSQVSGYRQRLHEWFRRYQECGWPVETPEYLLLGYFDMVHAIGDVPAMVACATDTARQDRMLDISGGDVAALAEIINTMEIAAKEPPDLTAMVRLAMHRDYLRSRNSRIPGTLPEVWALLGQFNRAEVMANSITDPQRHDLALSLVAATMAEAGKLDQAETLTLGIADVGVQAIAFASVAKAAATKEERDRAIRLAKLVAAADVLDVEDRLTSLALAAEAAARTGDVDDAVHLLDQVASLSGPMHLPGRVVRAIVRASAALTADDPLDLSTCVRRAVDARDGPLQRQSVLSAVTGTSSAIGGLLAASAWIDKAETVVSRIESGALPADYVVRLAMTAAASGHDRAIALLEQVNKLTCAERVTHRRAEIAADKGDERAELMSAAARAAVLAGDPRRAGELAEQSAAIARAVVDVHQQASALASVAESAAAIGDNRTALLLRQAGASAWAINGFIRRLRAVGRVAKAAAMAGDIDRAREFVCRVEAYGFIETLESSNDQPRLFELAIETMVAAGDLDRATRLLAQGEDVTPVRGTQNRVRGLLPLARAAASGGMLAPAAMLADEMEGLVACLDEYWQTEALACAALVRAATAELDRAAALLDRAEELARSIGRSDQRDSALGTVAAAAAAFDVDRIDRVVQAMVNPRQQAQALAQTAACHNPARRAQVLAQALRLAEWHLPVCPLVELVPEALSAIITELEVVQRGA